MAGDTCTPVLWTSAHFGALTHIQLRMLPSWHLRLWEIFERLGLWLFHVTSPIPNDFTHKKYQAVVTPAPWARWSFAQVLPNWRVHWRPSDRKPLVNWKRLGNGLSHKSSRRLPEILMVQTIQNRGLVARFATFYPYLWSFQQGESWQTIKFGGIKKKTFVNPNIYCT